MRSAAARLLLIPLITATIALTGCTPKTSLERHTRHYVYASDDGFDPNFYTQKADTIRMMLPFFQQFRDMGMKDKAAGVSAETAQQRVKEFHSEKIFFTHSGAQQPLLAENTQTAICLRRKK
ncbi:hypothetical protein MY005_49760 [Escherichia coli]|nr:hypothetical protein MY005_49650 [Escherichia coli]GHN89343.1 hypothetical protein MY005_49760 [Escherichia coli]